MGKCITCTVLLKDGGKDIVIINEADFDSAIHKKVMEKKAVDPDATESEGSKTSKKEAK